MLKLFGKRRAYDVKEVDGKINAEYAFENVMIDGARVNRIIASFFNKCDDWGLFREWLNDTFSAEQAEYIYQFATCGKCEYENDVERWLAARSK